MALEEYNNKRNFSQTAEPKGDSTKNGGKLRFVVQRHAASHLHYDFRLEMEGVLKSWAVPKGPSLFPGDKRLAMLVEDHPLEYRNFEGEIPKGNYGAGLVEIWDQGTYEPIEIEKNEPAEKVLKRDFKKGSLKFVLHGKKLKGEFALVQIKSSESENSWLLIKHKDRYASTEPYAAEANTAKNSKVTTFLNEKKSKKKDHISSTQNHYANFATALRGKQKLTEFIKPMLARSATKPFDDPEWAFEIKWDGYRAIADLRTDLKLYSRNGLDFTSLFKPIKNQLQLQEHAMVLDGELVGYDDNGLPNFQWLQQYGERPNMIVLYHVFDLLWLNGHSCESLTYLERKELLKDALKQTSNVQYCDYVVNEGNAFFRAAKKLKLEGMVAKKTQSLYHQDSRSTEWLKIKLEQTQEAVIIGFTEPKGARAHFGSLILARANTDGELSFAGQVGTGFSEKTLKALHSEMTPLIISECPLETTPKTNAKPTWITPLLIAEIKYTEITKEGRFRHPVFLHLRKDKAVENLSPELNDNSLGKDRNLKEDTAKEKKPKKKIQSSKNLEKNLDKVSLTHQSKIYFPQDKLTKGDLVAYYQSISEFILPHLKDRPQSLHRFPGGIKALSFYQKEAGDSIPTWLQTEKIYSKSTEEYINYILCNDKATLAYLNNLGAIEMNVWTSTIKNLENPDYLALDLDPSSGNTFEHVVETALAVKSILDRAKIKGYPKTSGSSGIHIFIPMGGLYSFDQVKDFAHLLMQMVQNQLPGLTTLERSLKKRDSKKIYLDYLQNRKAQTLASVYSVRPKNGAPVSMPLEWREVKPGIKPTDWTIENALERLKSKGDLFKPTLGQGIDMLKAIENLSK